MGLEIFSLPRVVLVIHIVGLLDLLGASCVAPLLPYQATELGADAVTIGYLGTFYGTLQLVSSPYVGRISDKYGRKTVLLLSCGASAFSYFCQGCAWSLITLTLARIPIGLLKHGLGSAQAAISDHYEGKEKKLTALSRHNAFLALGFIIGPTIGGLMHRFGTHVPSFIGCGVFLVNFSLVYWMLDLRHPPPRKVEDSDDDVGRKKTTTSKGEGNVDGEGENGKVILPKLKQKGAIASLRSFILHAVPVIAVVSSAMDRKAAVLLFTSRFVYSFVSNIFKSSLTLMMKFVLGFSVRETGFLMSYLGTLGFLVQLYGVELFSRFISRHFISAKNIVLKDTSTIRYATYLQAFAYVCLAFVTAYGQAHASTAAMTGDDTFNASSSVNAASSEWNHHHVIVLALFVVILAFLYLATGTIKTQFINAVTDMFSDNKGEALGSASFLDSVCRVTSPTIGGLIIHYVNHAWVFGICAVLTLIQVILIYVTESYEKIAEREHTKKARSRRASET